MENLASTQVRDYIRFTGWSQIDRTITDTDGAMSVPNVWRGAGHIVGRYRHEMRAITAGPPPLTGSTTTGTARIAIFR